MVIADSEDTVVELSVLALRVAEDGVANLGHGGLQGGLGVGHPLGAAVGGHEGVGLGPALAVPGLIGVVSLGVGSVPHGLPGAVHVATVAGALAAVNHLLLGEAVQGAVGVHPHALHGTSGREGPAGAALALVLHWGHLTLLPEVNVAGGGVVEVLPGDAVKVLRSLVSQHPLGEFLLGPVR